MKNFLKQISIFLFLFTAGNLSGQANPDSLRHLLLTDRNDTNRVNHYYLLGYALYAANPDSTILLGTQGVELAQKINFVNGLAKNYSVVGIGYWAKGDYPSALENQFKALDISQKNSYAKGTSSALGNIGLVSWNMGNYPQAFEYYFRALQIAEAENDTEAIGRHCSNIASVYRDQSDFSAAMKYDQRALAIYRKLGMKSKIAIVLGNIGISYNSMARYDEALKFYSEALQIQNESGNKKLQAVTLGNIGNVYEEEFKYDTALLHYNEAFTISASLADKKGIERQLANIGRVQILIGKYADAYKNIYRAAAISDSIGAKNDLMQCYKLLSELYLKSSISLPDSSGKILSMEQMRLQSLYCLKSFLNLRDTIFSEENKKQLVRKEMNYEFEKKEAQARAEQDKKDAIGKQELKQKENERNYFISGFALVLFLAGFIFRGYRQKQKTNTIISHQKLLVEEKQKEILDSIHYAKRIQQAILPKELYIEKSLTKLKDKTGN